MTTKIIRTRFAPSPTGPLHMGGVRTALYAYLFARKHNGKFILRIEDTDQNRYVKGAEQYIIDSLKWCGIEVDEGPHIGGAYAPYRQSERKELGYYQQYAEKLIASGHAYYAFDTNEALDIKRKEAEANKTSFQYNAQTRTSLKNSLTLSANETAELLKQNLAHVIRLKVPEAEEISFTDMIRGEVIFHSSQVDDKVLIKADGMPTYHLAHIVDDIMMEITHAIRGEEWLPSAPAHILIYKYLGLENSMPQYAHLPLLLKPDGNGKLSKRDGDRLGFPVFPLQWTDPVTKEISSGYREREYYPEAFVNMLAFLGWNDGTEKEIFSMHELIEAFSFERVHKAGAKFDPEKAKWFNQQYLRKQNNEAIAERFIPVIKQELKCDETDYRVQLTYVTQAVALLKDRVHFEHELWNTGIYLFVAPTTYDEKVIVKKWNTTAADFFKKLMIAFDAMEEFSATSTEISFKETATQNNLKPGDVLQLFRVLLTGVANGVALFDMVALLGKVEMKERIEFALKELEGYKTSALNS